MDCSRQLEVAFDFLQHNEISSDVVQALRQAVDVFATSARSHPASSPTAIDTNARKFKPSSSKRQQLTAEEAAEIYNMRPKVDGKDTRPKRGSMIRCKAIAPKYGVSAKTIRDIWRGRTWIEATRHLWTREEKRRRALNNNDESSESEAEESSQPTSEVPAQQHTGHFGPHHQVPSLQSMPANCNQMQASTFWNQRSGMNAASNSQCWPNFVPINNVPMSSAPMIPTPSVQQCTSFNASGLSPQLLQQKISMLEMALQAYKTSAPAPASATVFSPFQGGGCTAQQVSANFPVSGTNMLMNQYAAMGGYMQSSQLATPTTTRFQPF